MQNGEADIEALMARVRDAVEAGTLRDIEQAVIELRLARLGTVPKAAPGLGLSLPTLYKKVRYYQLADGRQRREAKRPANGREGSGNGVRR